MLRRFRVPLVIVAVCPILAACAGAGPDLGDPSAGAGSIAAIVVATGAADLPATVDELPVVDVAGFRTLLEQMRGTPVVVNVWASWCEPCRRELPLLRDAAEQHRDVQFLGVDIQDSRSGAEGFIAEFGIPYPNVFDPQGAIRDDLGSIGQPVTVFYDSQGAQVAKIDGELTEDDLRVNLRAIAG